MIRLFTPERLLARRRAVGMTQRELAVKAGLSTVSISTIENGKKEPRVGTMARLADALRVRVDYFFA